MKKKNDFYVVGVGASAGGLEAITVLFDHIPENTDMAFVIVQHLSSDYKSFMDELLFKHTKMKISIAEHNMEVKKNHIYLIPRDKNITITNDYIIELIEKAPAKSLNLPIDLFFNSLGMELTDKAIGIILSGTGTDGSRGIKSIKESGGMVMVQDTESAKFDGMPTAAIQTKIPDFISKPENLAKELMQFAKNPNIPLSFFENNEEADDIEVIDKLFQEVYAFSGIQFKYYKINTIFRRIEKRMVINHLTNLKDYFIYVRDNKKEAEILYKEFLIGVTGFFRDVEAYKILELKVIPEIISKADKNIPLRIWVAACSTGEEAYSIAILMEEYLTNNKLDLEYKIFATDIDQTAIEFAARGTYNNSITADVNPLLLEKYFVLENNTFTVRKKIREKIIFAKHDIINDASFIKLDLITCRNFLIYIKAFMQRKILANFNYSLNSNGYLFLGSSESLGDLEEYFKVVNSKWKIYIKDSEKTIPKLEMFKVDNDLLGILNKNEKTKKIERKSNKVEVNRKNEIDVYTDFLLRKYSPTCIFISENYDLLYSYGALNEILQMPKKSFTSNVLSMVDDSLEIIIKNGTKKTIFENRTIIYENVLLLDSNRSFRLIFTPIIRSLNLDKIIAIEIRENKEQIDDSMVIEKLTKEEITNERIQYLEQELELTKNQLKATVEKLETSNEELQTSNEELISSNEELQSTNEELQSVNEELYTVNAELNMKIEEQTILINDINNMLNSTEIGTVFLDINFYIRKFTSAIYELFNLEKTDIGRPLAHFSQNFYYHNILNDAKAVLEKLIPIEREIRTENNQYFLMKITPYRTIEQKIEGVVITFVNITRRKENEISLSDSKKKYIALYNNMLNNVVIYKVIKTKQNKKYDLEYIDVNNRFEEKTQISKNKVIGKKISEIFPEFVDDHQDIINRIADVAYTGKEIKLEYEMKSIEKWFSLSAFSTEEGYVATVTEDITDKKEKENKINNYKEFLEKIYDSVDFGIFVIDYDKEKRKYIFTSINSKMEGFYKVKKDEVINLDLKEIKEKSNSNIMKNILKNIQYSIKEKSNISFEFKSKEDNILKWYKIYLNISLDKKNRIYRILGSVNEVTEIKQLNEAIIINEEKFRGLFTSIKDGLYRTTQNGIIIEANDAFENMLGYSKGELINQSIYDILPSKWHSFEKDIIEKKLKESNYTDLIEKELLKKDGIIIPVNVIKWVISDKNDEDRYIWGIVRDISIQKEIENRLKEREKELLLANNIKSEFISNISHELRTPLNGIIGISSSFMKYKSQNLSQEQVEYLSLINYSGKRLLTLIEDVLDVSKIDSGKIKIEMMPILIKDFINNIYNEFKIMLNDISEQENKIKDLEFKITTAENLPKTIYCDRLRLNQIIINLLNNSIKFTDKGRIELKIELKNDRIYFEVFDSGIGISFENVNHIFEKFTQLENTLTKKYKGTGIGLSLCSKLVTLLNGEITVESKINEWTRFTFFVPNILDDQFEKYYKRYISTKPEKILIVDDEKIGRETLKIILDEKYELLFSENGIEALELLLQEEVGLILVDIMMPEMDGYRLYNEIRIKNKKTPIIAVSARVLGKEKEKIEKYGFDVFVEKPIDEKILISNIEKALMKSK